jgi:ADP-ribosylglycohydrolase/fructose-1,6-bisphosphatase/inositol monophosphatase family enzyme
MKEEALLSGVVAAVEAEGRRLREEFYRAEGPRGRRGHCPADREIEESLRVQLERLVPCAFAGEETEPTADAAEVWLVDPHDGTFEFMNGRRGSAISVALVRNGVPVLGVVHAPDSPDRGPDTVAWAEGAGPVRRNGAPVGASLAGRLPVAGELVWATASSAARPVTHSLAAAPARYVAMPSIAYRMARVAAGDGIATLSTHSVNEYDIAAGMALIRGAGGVTLDAEGNEVRLEGNSRRRVSGCFAGAPEAARQLAKFDWRQLEAEPRRNARVSLGFPRKFEPKRLSRAQGCLLGQVIGDSLGSLVELKPAPEIAQLYPRGVRELADGGVYKTIAGQPTDDSEMALTLARALVRDRKHDRERVLDAYRGWLTSRPIDVGMTTERGLLGRGDASSESNGSLMRVSPIGVWAAGDARRAAKAARADSALTHPNPVCVEACAGYAAAIAAGVGGGDRNAMLEAALEHSSGPARAAIMLGATSTAPADFFTKQGWVLVALQNAFFALFHESFEEGLVRTVGQGGDTDTNAAIAGALLGAAQGREAVPSRWILAVLACRPLAECGALRPRPAEYWPDDILELAEALLG